MNQVPQKKVYYPRPGAGGHRQGAGEAAPNESKEKRERRPASQLSRDDVGDTRLLRAGHLAGFADRQCLLARRFAEEGVRFIEVSAGGWDTHRNMRTELANRCGAVDKPIAGLLTDLKRRNMLDDTLVVWGGEFGRTPTS